MTNQDLHLEFFLKIKHVYGQKIIDHPVWQTRISPGIFLKIQMHMVKWWLTPPEWQTRISPRIFFRVNMHMVKRWLIPLDDRPGSHLEFFLKIQHVYGQ